MSLTCVYKLPIVNIFKENQSPQCTNRPCSSLWPLPKALFPSINIVRGSTSLPSSRTIRSILLQKNLPGFFERSSHQHHLHRLTRLRAANVHYFPTVKDPLLIIQKAVVSPIKVQQAAHRRKSTHLQSNKASAHRKPSVGV